MPNPTTRPFEVMQAAQVLGERIRLARVRRRLSQDELAQACKLNRRTLYRIESGSPGIAVGNIYTVLWTLGLLATTEGVADPDADEQGKTLDAGRQAQRVRHPSEKPDENDF